VRVGTVLSNTQMGGEGAQWVGAQPFLEQDHGFQNIGDGTLFHSGWLGIRFAVAAGTRITFKLLYNGAVAMTGGQSAPGTMAVPELIRGLKAEGVGKVIVTVEDPATYRRGTLPKGTEVWHRDRILEAQRLLAAESGVTVLLYDQACAAELRRARKRGRAPTPTRRVVINSRVCEGCGDCGVKSNCLSVLPLTTEFGEKRQIHDPSCNRDYTCLEGDCPSFVTIKPRTRGKRRTRAADSPQATTSTTPTTPTTSATSARPALPSGSLPVPTPPAPVRRYGIYFTGIGGTGVVTANRIIATAAENAGFAIGGVDQTGLSQKAGAVVSHLHLARSRADLGIATVGTEDADLYLSGDILQAASAKHLAKVRFGATRAVVDPQVTPTSNMLQSDQAAPGTASLEAVITEATGDGRAVFVDAKRVAEAVFSDHMLANVILLGAAFQVGGLPLSLADVDQAMRRQGRAAASNREAFEWGRWAAHDPEAVAAALASAPSAGEPSGPFEPSAGALATARDLVAGRNLPASLRDLLTRRAAQAADFQDARRAGRFLDLVERTAARDDDEHGWALTRAVAESWFKLLTYKDEYEVARLHLAADYDKAARELGIDGPYSVTYHLHPPILRRLGMTRKLPLGKPYELAFRVLRPMKRLRGTPLDVFGWDKDRRQERAVIAEYERLIDEVGAAGPADADYDTLVRIAESAQSVKGYGPIKEAAVAAWRAQVAGLRERPRDTTARA
ncbi:MAG TPA: DUF6537 domain-containing protein, partial [Trebonia sp.]|nr:DUF6537 domain-containing protein [Trebonia sp.]